MICTTPRTGSTWLCDRLTRRGLGAPGEQLKDLLGVGKRASEDLRRLWATHTLNGVYGVKVFMEEPDRRLDLDDMLPPGRRAFIYLTRDDRVQQAWSLALAYRYGGWDGHGDRGLEVSAEEVVAARREIETATKVWHRWFVVHGINPLHVTYEQSITDPEGVVDRIVGFVLGV